MTEPESRIVINDTAQFQSLTLARPPAWGQITITTPDGEPLVTIHTEDGGRLEYGPNYSPDEAARAFWGAMADHAGSMHTLYGRGLTQRINEQLEAGQRAEEQLAATQAECDAIEAGYGSPDVRDAVARIRAALGT